MKIADDSISADSFPCQHLTLNCIEVFLCVTWWYYTVYETFEFKARHTRCKQYDIFSFFLLLLLSAPEKPLHFQHISVAFSCNRLACISMDWNKSFMLVVFCMSTGLVQVFVTGDFQDPVDFTRQVSFLSMNENELTSCILGCNVTLNTVYNLNPVYSVWMKMWFAASESFKPWCPIYVQSYSIHTYFKVCLN